MSPSTTAVLFNLTRFAWIVPFTIPPTVNSSRDNVAFYFGAFVYQNGQCSEFTLDLAK